jgi:ABC-2 type transport system ATP-binding protein
MLDFGAQLDELATAYSHGMKKKLALLCALVHRPQVLLLDEPTNGLDPQIAARVRELLKAQADAGTTVLLSTHLLDMVERICDRMIVLRRGRKLGEGTTEQLRALAGLPPGAELEAALLKLLGD